MTGGNIRAFGKQHAWSVTATARKNYKDKENGKVAQAGCLSLN
jgi:hypothetical protein